MSRISGKLELTVYEGRDLKKEDMGKMDPYCKLELHKEHFKTKVHKKAGQTPKWDQTFLFNLKDVDEKEILHFQVWDEDLLSDDKIGRADIPLSGLAQHTDKKDGAWIQLVEFDNFKKIAGYIRVGVKFDGTGWPVEKPKPQEHKEEHHHEEHHRREEHHHRPEHHHETPQPTYVPTPTPQPTYVPTPQPTFVPTPQPTFVTPTPTFVPTQPTYPTFTQPIIVTQTPVQYTPTPVFIPTTTPTPTPTYVAPTHTGPRHTLNVNERLSANEKLTSSNGRFVAIFQTDGNFVIYEGSRPLWASKTSGVGAAYVVNQSDANLVIYTSSGSPLWASDTYGKGTSGATHLIMQDDGNLVLYSGSVPLWASGTQQHETKVSSADTVHTNGSLKVNEKITSQNGKYHAIMQGDGNFVLYQGSKPLWASNTSGSGATYVIVQGDHNLVLYDSAGAPKWASDTYGKGSSPSHLIMQNDGNLVLYSGSTPLWASNTYQVEKKESDTLHENSKLGHNEKIVSQDGRYTAIMQGDGNFVVYGGSALWATATNGTGASHVILQGDKNLVVYDSAGSPKWASNTSGRGSGQTRLVMQNDGNLVIYDGTGAATWASGTSGRY